MIFRENPIFGRKVFFINPPFAVEKKVIEILKEQEYEIYIIKDYVYAKSVLRNFDNAMCFINIDQQLTIKEWYNFIKSFEFDETLKTIFLGIMASKTPEASIEKFIMNLKLPGGYVPLNGATPEEIAGKLQGILEINGAKGKRKYLSLTCDKEEALSGYISHGSKLYSMTFENISSIGISCYLEKDLANFLVKGTVLPNVCLSLGRWSVITQCFVYSINVLNGKITALLLFVKDTPKEVKDSLRKFIYDVLNKNLRSLISAATADAENYYTIVFPSDEKTPDYNAPTDDDTTVDNVEEIDASADSNKNSEEAGTENKTEKADEPAENSTQDNKPAEDTKSENSEPAPAADTKSKPEEKA